MMNRRSILLSGAALAAPALLAACAEEPAVVSSAPPPPATQAPGFYRYKVGSLNVTTVNDGFASFPLNGFVVNKPLAEVQAVLRANFEPEDRLRVPFNVTFVETRRGLVAFDAGNGALAPTDTRGRMIANMAAAGIDPAKVVAVVISHFHADHISGLTTAEGLRAFPNAEVVVPQTEWRFWNDAGNESRSPERQRPSFANTARRFQVYDGRIRVIRDNAEVMPGIRAVAAHGHTPGHTAYHIADGDAQLMYVADVTNRPVPMALNPGWHAVVDFDAAMAEATRRRMYDRLSADRVAMTGYHFPFPAYGHLIREGGGYRFRLADWQSTV